MSTPAKSNVSIWPSALALVASGLGLAFSLSSSLDYTRHLDRQVHDLHCSFIPGAAAEAGQEAACRAAMYSPYSALFKDRYWGGIPISLPAVGAFAFFAAFALYLLLSRNNAPRRAYQFQFWAGITPLLVSAVMFVISLTKLGQFCKTCVGIYSASVLLAIASIGALIVDIQRSRRALEEFRHPSKTVYSAPLDAAKAPEKDDGKVAPTLIEGEVPAIETPPEPIKEKESEPFVPPRTGGFALIPSWLIALTAFSLVPALLYISALPTYGSYLGGCGKLEKPADPTNALIHITPAGAKQQATMVVDPLCPTCKAFHQRLVAEGVFEQLDTTLVLFPLDNECNWMLDRPVHPGACVVAKAIMCSDKRAQSTLEWAYDKQEALLAAAKGEGGIAAVRSMIRESYPTLDACIDSKETKQRLEKTLRFAVNNQLPVSTPQLFLDGTRLCDEDSDIGLSYTLSKLAPNLVRHP